jgi:hypothetical protein
MSNGDKLLTAIEENGGTDVVIQYWDIARLFPSDVPHPDSFDYKVIDHHSLKEWAASNGFKVMTVPERAPDHAKHSPPVRFIKII